MGIYVLAVVLNFLVNFLLILGTNQILNEHLSWKRVAVAAGFGGIYAAVCLRWHFWGHTLWHVCAICLMSKLAFGKLLGRRGLVFLLLQLAVSGIAAGLHSSGLASVAVTVVCVCVMFLSGIWEKREKFVPVELFYGEKKVCLTALCDTGNTLQDPLTGSSVLVVGADVAEELTGLTPSQLRCPVAAVSKRLISGLRLIPYHTIDTADGMLLGVWIPQAKIGKQKTGVLVALAPEKLSEDGKFQALIGGVN